jgi:hypothetical protein
MAEKKQNTADQGIEIVTQRFFTAKRDEVFAWLLGGATTDEPLPATGRLERVEADVISVIEDRLIVGIADVETLDAERYTATFSMELSDMPGGTAVELRMEATPLEGGEPDADDASDSADIAGQAVRELAKVLLTK